jgi:hypothetical protein
LLIEAYFQQIQALLTASPIIHNSQITYASRGSFEGYIRGELSLIDGSVLHVREYVDVETQIERLTYAYHYIAADGQFCFRYDNTDHHRHLKLPTHPHHCHDGNEANVIASSAPDLTAVLHEIEQRLTLS